MIVQIYEIQEPREAERLIEMGVDRIGSVILSPEAWKNPSVREVVRLVRGSGAKSSLIPLLAREDEILRALDYYEPDFVHFCEWIPLDPEMGPQREAVCAEMIRLQRLVKKEFPPFGVTRSIPIPEPGRIDADSIRETLLEIARTLEPCTDCFMTDTLRGYEGEGVSQPVAGYVGITGEICDWDLASTLVGASRIPVILAGGISPENVREAVGRVRPAGVDSCTQTNVRDNRGTPIRFRKDFERVRRLLAEIREERE
jgi:phosphoribosylanthranilate isomerase